VLTLRNCTHPAEGTDYNTRYSSPLLGATAALLHAAPSKDLYHPAPWRIGYRGLREVVLHWDASQEHAHITCFMLADLAPVPSVTIHADSIMLRVPRALDPLPLTLKLVTRSMQLVRRDRGAPLESDLASFRSRCDLVIEGVCLDEVVASWVPLTHRDPVEIIHGYDYGSEDELWEGYAASDSEVDVDEF